jgi:hypothetical protein
MSTRDRRAKILGSLDVNGIDFVEIANFAQTHLRVHFLNAVAVKPLSVAPVISGGETIATVAVLPVAPSDWGWDDGHVVLSLRVAAPGDFSIYTLQLTGPNIDSFYSGVRFSFKAGCTSDLDCAPIAPACPPLSGDAPAIDYLAKDFLSFRQALLDFSTQRYPNWQERSEADFGVMFLEALSAIGDELSYTQDRIAAEASLLTATQRRSALRHARLVDYEPGPALSATAVLQFEVNAGATDIPNGLAVIAPGPEGSPIVFETGLGLRDSSSPPPANAKWNNSPQPNAYWFDDSVSCLQPGATQMDVTGPGYDFRPGQALLIETASNDSIDPPLRQVVHLLKAGDPRGSWAQEVFDELFNLTVTRIRWEAADALTAARDLARTTVSGNIALATQGRTVTESFAIGVSQSSLPQAIERAGPSPAAAPDMADIRPAIRLYTLAKSPLTWLPPAAGDSTALPRPEIQIATVPAPAAGSPDGTWSWFKSLLEAGPFDNGFTLDPASYRALGRNSDSSTAYEYDGGAGDTIRFGDGVFGSNPDPGTQFAVAYRFGVGAAGNVATGAVSQLDPVVAATGRFRSVTNIFPATGGADAQSLQSVQRLAPQQFRTVMLRAVLPADYAAAAETLPWVQRAGTALRWTGSWLTTFTTPEPKASEQIQTSDRTSLITLLNRYRMAGTESYVPDPDYVSIDLIVEICALANAFAADVKQAVLAALSPTGASMASAFFAVSRFVFGQPLQRSALEAAVQAIPGVAGITCIHYRLRNHTQDFAEMGNSVVVGASQILRCDNDPSRPNNGALTLVVRGGR